MDSRDSDSSDDERADDDQRADVHDIISMLKVNSDALNKSLNNYYRFIFKDIATDTNPVPL